ncbi:MAG: hypothetical protein AB7O96_08775 [Pseudobdellovibrionaceae bacterium]
MFKKFKVFERVNKKWGLWAAIGVFFGIRMFWIDTVPILTNDSVSYLHMAKNDELFSSLRTLLEIRTLKTVGYGLFLKLIDSLGFLLPYDFLGNVVLVQHLIWLAIILWAIALIGFWVIPVMMVMSAPFFVWSTNTILTEPLTVALVCILFLSSVQFSNLLTAKKLPKYNFQWFFLVFLIGLSFVWLILVKFFYLATGLIVLAPAVTVFLSKTRSRERIKMSLVGASIALVLGATVVGLQSYYNYDRYGKFTPVSAQGRVLFWGIWTSVFNLRTHAFKNPKIIENYTGKNLYDYITNANLECRKNFDCENKILDLESQKLVEVSGLKLDEARIRSFLMALIGGEKNELHAMRQSFLTQDRARKNQGDYWLVDASTVKTGTAATLEKFNESQMPNVIYGFSQWPVFDGFVTAAQGLISFCYFFGCLWLLGKRKFNGWFFALSGLVAQVVVCFAFAWFLTDIWRYLQTWWILACLSMAYFISANLKLEFKE